MKPSREKLLIVDGHNTLNCTPWLQEIHDKNQMEGRNALIRELSNLQNMSDYRIVLVFDGSSRKRSYQGGTEDDILVTYSRQGETADRVIESYALKFADKMQIDIASNDRTILDSTYISGAHGMSVTNLWEMLERETSKFLKKYKKNIKK